MIANYTVFHVDEYDKSHIDKFGNIDAAVAFYNSIILRYKFQSKSLWKNAECSLDDILVLWDKI